MKKYKNKIVAAVAVIAVLTLVYWWGGNAPSMRGWTPQTNSDMVVQQDDTPSDGTDISVEPVTQPDELTEPIETIPEQAAEPVTQQQQPNSPDSTSVTDDNKTEMAQHSSGVNSIPEAQGDVEYSRSNGMEIDAATVKDIYQTSPVPVGKPVPVEPQEVVISDKVLTCTLSVRCDTILDNLDWLDKEKTELVPDDGVIFEEKTVTFYEGESVFNVLLREMKRNNIHMEFEDTPIYNSAYIEGIGNLYEFDCGELSGWMYKVNGWFPNYGCSRYQLSDGDKVEWVYTCDLGADVGGHYSAKGE